jgi:hypothetical protein
MSSRLDRLQSLHRNERVGSSLFVGAGGMAFIAGITLAIEVGPFTTCGSQAQVAVSVHPRQLLSDM